MISSNMNPPNAHMNISHSLKKTSAEVINAQPIANKLLETKSTENINTTSAGYAWRAITIEYSGEYYEEEYNTTSKEWTLVKKSGKIYAFGDIVKVANDPMKNDVVHVFLVNLTPENITIDSSVVTLFKIQHFIINTTTRSIIYAYILKIYVNTSEYGYRDFGGITAFQYNDNGQLKLALVYVLLEYNVSSEKNDVIGYIRIFNATVFWNDHQDAWTQQNVLFRLENPDYDYRFVRDLSYTCLLYTSPSPRDRG